MQDSKISWTDHTFNPWMGCAKVSAGCAHCYAEALTSNRMGLSVWGREAPRQRTSAAYWRVPRGWNTAARRSGQPQRVFSGSLCDVFEDRPDLAPWRADLWELVRSTPDLDWLLLTKRPENIAAMLPSDWGEGWANVWLGTSVEQMRVAHRIAALAAVPAVVHFVSYEPALGPLHEADLSSIEWLIYGGESGPGFRPDDPAWARAMRNRCRESGIAFYYKQAANRLPGRGTALDGELIHEYPTSRQSAHDTRQAEATTLPLL